MGWSDVGLGAVEQFAGATALALATVFLSVMVFNPLCLLVCRSHYQHQISHTHVQFGISNVPGYE